MRSSVLLLTAFLSTSLAWLPGNRSSASGLSKRMSEPSKIRGVNLGSHFIMESWMAWDEWTNMGCSAYDDEWSCVQGLGQDKADSAFQNHWSTWITQDDINKIASYGLNTVRVPLGFWVYRYLVDDGEYYPRGAMNHLDNLMAWCKEAGLYVILGLHGAPGVQAVNQQFTGHKVSDPEFYQTSNYNRALDFLEWMTGRIHTTDSYSTVGMIEVVNEPVYTSYGWQAPNMVQNYYPEAYNRIRNKEASLGVAEGDELHIQYMSAAWGSGDPNSYLPDTKTSLSYDNHRYLVFDTSVTQTQDGYMKSACQSNTVGSIVGEWSLAIAGDASTSSEFAISPLTDSVKSWYNKFWAVQASTYEAGDGWIFWSWKTNLNDFRWDYQAGVSAGVIPTDASSASSIASSECSSIGARDESSIGKRSDREVDGVKYVAQHRAW